MWFSVEKRNLPRSARLGPEAVTGELSAGTPIVVTFLMNVVTSMRVTA
jgi:hypothetical protein